MIVIVDRQEKQSEVNKVLIDIGGTRFRITESVDGKLCINKYDFDNGELSIFPRYSNEIEIT